MNKEDNQVIQILSDINELVTKNDVIEPFKDLPIIRMLEVGRQIWNHHKENKMKRFLIGFSKNIEDTNQYVLSDRNKLQRYLKDDFTRDKFFNILDKALETNSELASEILGYYAGKILDTSEKLSYQHTIIISALTNMNDWDIGNFYKAYEYFKTLERNEKVNALSLYHKLSIDNPKYNELDDYEFDEEFLSFKSTLMKLANLQVFILGEILWAQDSQTIIRTKASEELFDVMNSFNIPIYLKGLT